MISTRTLTRMPCPDRKIMVGMCLTETTNTKMPLPPLHLKEEEDSVFEPCQTVKSSTPCLKDGLFEEPSHFVPEGAACMIEFLGREDTIGQAGKVLVRHFPCLPLGFPLSKPGRKNRRVRSLVCPLPPGCACQVADRITVGRTDVLRSGLHCQPGGQPIDLSDPQPLRKHQVVIGT